MELERTEYLQKQNLKVDGLEQALNMRVITHDSCKHMHFRQ